MTDQDEAEVLAERIRDSIASSRFAFDWAGQHPIPFTISVGVAALGSDEGSIDGVMERADIALYAAKNGGRNCVRVWQSHLPVSDCRPFQPVRARPTGRDCDPYVARSNAA
jgi:diguanylate cyclase (GGDEF)-like protein